MGIHEQGMQNGLELACNEYSSVDGVKVQLKGMFDGYVLTDVKNNPESGVVASVASHVYNSIIVDIRDKEYFEKAGYKMKYDATRKTTVDAWREFRNKCSKKALVIMPVQTGELREFAIKKPSVCIEPEQGTGRRWGRTKHFITRRSACLAGTQCSGIRLGARSE